MHLLSQIVNVGNKDFPFPHLGILQICLLVLSSVFEIMYTFFSLVDDTASSTKLGALCKKKLHVIKLKKREFLSVCLNQFQTMTRL